MRSILIFSAAGIGDTLTDSVAIRAIKESYPHARVLVVTHRRRSVLALHNPFIDLVIPYHKSFLFFPFLAYRLRQLQPDAVIMLRGNDPDLWPLAYLANRHAIVSCPVMTRFKFLISHPVNLPQWSETHGVLQTLQIAKAIQATTVNTGLVYKVNETEKETTRLKIKTLLPDFSTDEPWIVFQVGGSRRSSWRDWPAENFVEIGKRILNLKGFKLILLGGPDLKQNALKIEKQLPSPIWNLTGHLSLSESAALLSMSRLLVSTDTGIMHLGFAVGVPTVALIHCVNPASRVGPYGYGDQHAVVQLTPPPGVSVSKQVSMSGITPEMVWKKIQSLLFSTKT